MKKWLLIFVFGGLLFWIWIALRLTNTFNFFLLRSPANRPTLDSGMVVFTSNLKEPGYNNFIE